MATQILFHCVDVWNLQEFSNFSAFPGLAVLYSTWCKWLTTKAEIGQLFPHEPFSLSLDFQGSVPCPLLKPQPITLSSAVFPTKKCSQLLSPWFPQVAMCDVMCFVVFSGDVCIFGCVCESSLSSPTDSSPCVQVCSFPGTVIWCVSPLLNP